MWLGKAIPKWIIFATATLFVAVFTACFLTFNYPLTNCDSPSWAKSYFGILMGESFPIATPRRGWVAPIFFHYLGQFSLTLNFPNLIGLTQSFLLLGSLFMLARIFLKGATRAELILLPAFLYSALHHAYFAQMIFSESLVLTLCFALWYILFSNPLTIWRTVASVLLLAVIVQIRIDCIYMLPIIWVAIWRSSNIKENSFLVCGLTLLVLVAAHIALLLPLMPNWRPFPPIGKIMVMGEWIRYTDEPQNPIAKALHHPLVDETRNALKNYDKPIEHLNAGIPVSKDLVVNPERGTLGWGSIFKLIAYQLSNKPKDVLRDRALIFYDQYMGPASAFIPDYKKASYYFVSFWERFYRWSPEKLNSFENVFCRKGGQLQRDYFQLPQVKSVATFEALKSIATAIPAYFRYVLAPLLFLTALGAIWVFKTRRADTTYILITLTILFHHGLRAALVEANERYALPVEFITLWWVALTIRAIASRDQSTPSAPPQ